jgi:hypothetical protein
LKVNGYHLEFEDLQAFEYRMDLYEKGRMRFPEIEQWLLNTWMQARSRDYSGLQAGSFTANAATAVH